MPSAAKINSIIESIGGDAPDAGSASEASASAPPTGSLSGTESASGAPQEPGGAPPSPSASPTGETAPEAPIVHELLAEKLRRTREKREAARELELAKAARAEAEAARKVAQEEEASWKSVRGNYREGLKRVGADARTAYEEMTREAIEAGTPEAKLRAMQAEWEAKLSSTVQPLQQTIEQLKKDLAERDEHVKRSREEALEATFQGDFARRVLDPKYESLRDEYADEQLLQIARNVKARWTSEGKRFTMHQILDHLKGVQDAHRADQEKRRAARTAATASPAAQQAASAKPTVNGTAERRNAAPNVIGNDLASARATGDGPSLGKSRRDRVRRLIDET